MLMSTEMFWTEQYKKVLHIYITMAWYFFLLFPDLNTFPSFCALVHHHAVLQSLAYHATLLQASI